MNGDKSKMIMVSDKDNPISIITEHNEIISCDKQVKVLGWWSNTKNTMDTHLARTKSIVHQQLFIKKTALQYLNLDQRKEIIRAKVISKIQYGLCFFAGQTEAIKAGISALIMYCYRRILNENTYKMRNKKICKKIGMETPTQLISKSALTFLQKILHFKMPLDIISLFRFSRLERRDKHIQLQYAPRTIKFQRIFLNTAVELLNLVDPKMRNMVPLKFKELLSNHTINFYPG